MNKEIFCQNYSSFLKFSLSVVLQRKKSRWQKFGKQSWKQLPFVADNFMPIYIPKIKVRYQSITEILTFSVSFAQWGLFKKNMALSHTITYGRPTPCKVSEKTNEPILRKLADRWKDRWVQVQMERPYFTGPFRPWLGVQKWYWNNYNLSSNTIFDCNDQTNFST